MNHGAVAWETLCYRPDASELLEELSVRNDGKGKWSWCGKGSWCGGNGGKGRERELVRGGLVGCIRSGEQRSSSTARFQESARRSDKKQQRGVTADPKVLRWSALSESYPAIATQQGPTSSATAPRNSPRRVLSRGARVRAQRWECGHRGHESGRVLRLGNFVSTL